MSNKLMITLKAMQFHALVGVLPHESVVPQLVEVDLSVSCGGPTSLTDLSPAAGVDYRVLYEIARDSLNSHTALLEEVADKIVTRTSRIAGVRSVRVAVRKPHAPLPGPLSYAEIVMERDVGE
jgi:dihydroneopterin aldolase